MVEDRSYGKLIKRIADASRAIADAAISLLSGARSAMHEMQDSNGNSVGVCPPGG